RRVDILASARYDIGVGWHISSHGSLSPVSKNFMATTQCSLHPQRMRLVSSKTPGVTSRMSVVLCVASVVTPLRRHLSHVRASFHVLSILSVIVCSPPDRKRPDNSKSN